jgi:hypothetical protein
MLCYVVVCYVMLCYVMLCLVMLYYVMLCCLYNVILVLNDNSYITTFVEYDQVQYCF